MKLYELDRGLNFKIVGYDNEDSIFRLNNIDGMYSHCTHLASGSTQHIAAYTEIIPYVKDKYLGCTAPLCRY